MLNAPGTPATSSPGPSSSSSTTTTPAGAQHRLMLKQTPIDVWSLREQLGLASAVLRSGDQNWVSVSRQMKPFSEEGRPHDWFSQKNCALQYNLLLEKVDTPRRKRTDKSEVTETPGEAIVRRLKAERLKELKSIIEKQASQIRRYEEEVQLLNDPSTSEEKVNEIETAINNEDKEDEERQKAHEAWLAEREEKKMAIQAALKAHSAKIPLKGAAAAAASAAQASMARRLSQQSERNSFSDVDSPASQSIEMIKHETEIVTQAVVTPATSATVLAVETTSPLLSSLLKSPTTSLIASNTTSSADKTPVDEAVVADEPMEVENDAPTNAENGTNGVKQATNGGDNDNVETKSEENVEELLAAAVDEVNEKMPDLIDILTGVEPEIEAENVVEKTEDVTLKNGDEVETLKEIKQEIEDKPTVADESPSESVRADDVENVEISNGVDVDDIKIEDDVAADDKVIADEDKPLTSDHKRLSKTASGSKSGRRSRKQSDVTVDDELSDARRETRSKKVSERSDEVSVSAGSGNLETASEESPLPPPTTPLGSRETRRTAAKKGPSVSSDTNDISEVIKDEKEESATPQNVADNRRLSRLKEKEASASRKSRRGSGATTTSRSSSPIISGDESESDPLLPRPTRTRQKSGRAGTSTSTQEPPNVTDETSRPESPDVTGDSILSDEQSSRDADEEWVKQASNILVEFAAHKSFEKLNNVDKVNVGVVLRPCSVESLRKGLEDGSIKSVQDFYAEFLLMLVNNVMESSSGSECYQSALSLFGEFNDTVQDVLMPFDLAAKSVPSTPLKSLPSSPSKTSSKGGESDAKKADLKRKRGSLSTTADDSPLTKKRKRI